MRVRTAHIIRAVLLAIAIAATLLGLRDRMSANHGSNFSGSNRIERIREVMPRTSNRRMYWSPILEICPSRSFPPLDLLSGVSPNQAANSRPLLNCLPLPTVATIVEAVMAPTPGIVRSSAMGGSSQAVHNNCNMAHYDADGAGAILTIRSVAIWVRNSPKTAQRLL